MSDIQTLLPPNATRTERDLEQVLARMVDIPVPINTLWNVETCPEAMLPYLAWALSVDVWDARWSLEIKRNVLRQAVPMHRVKGTRASVEAALATLGFTVDLSEWFEYGGDVHTFRLDAFGADVYSAGFSIDAALHATVTRLIQHTKPARSQFVLRIGESFAAEVYLRSDVRAAHIHRLELDPPTRTHTASATSYLRSGLRARITDIHEHNPASRKAKPSGSIYARTGSVARIISRITHNFNVKEGAAYAV
ncbi:phage tail protein I [Profundibacter sp.]